MKLIVGLWNPGNEYRYTRHNMGYMCVDFLRELWWGSPWSDSRHMGVVSDVSFQGERVYLLKPTTYMNRSGWSVQSMLHFYRMDPQTQLMVISDDIDMEFAKIRIKKTWSHGGQNGLRDIIAKIWTQDFSRLKIGIGRSDRMSPADWVLSRCSPTECEVLQEKVFPETVHRLETWILNS